MKNSRRSPSAILHHLEVEWDKATCPDGFDDAAAMYVPATDHPATVAEFEAEITRFTRYLFQKGMTPSQRISDCEAYAISVEALESAYSQKSMGGYASAVIEVLEDGVAETSMILQWLADALKEQILSHHRSCVIDSLLNELDWNSRMQLAAEIQSRYEHSGVEVFPGLDLHALASNLPSLLLTHLTVEGMPGALTASEMA